MKTVGLVADILLDNLSDQIFWYLTHGQLGVLVEELLHPVHQVQAVKITAVAVCLPFDFKLFILSPYFDEIVVLLGEVPRSAVGEVVEIGNLPVGSHSADPGHNAPFLPPVTFPSLLLLICCLNPH